MNASYAKTPDFQFFSPALDHFNAMIQHLESTRLQDHGTTEEYIRTNGDELLRLMFQGHLDKQFEDEEQAASVTASDGVRKRVATDAIDRSYDNVIKRHRENCPGIVGKHQAIKLVEDSSRDFVEFCEQRATEDEQTNDLLVLSFDGKGIGNAVGRVKGGDSQKCTEKQEKTPDPFKPGRKEKPKAHGYGGDSLYR